EFIEWEEVYAGNFYGTLKTEIERIWQEGRNVIFDVDVKGGINLKKYFGNKALAVFVKVPSIEVLKERLKERGTETEESLSRRIFKAKFEMTFQDKFDVVLVNEELDKSLQEAQRLYNAFKNS
ncbi:MAG TPA: guanylate kinase, partial [Cyclobacteriaceae bacterium]|nr:guanylate kinase [Cyclobacteriaceae bacterium]